MISKPLVIIITHANVIVDPQTPVPQRGLSDKGKLRHELFNQNPLVEGITSIYCSGEQKAIDGANILSQHLAVDYKTVEELHEKDRSSTGYLPEKEFWKVAQESFDKPYESIRGREKAVDAQKRMLMAVESIIEQDQTSGHIAIVNHGGVAAFLLCHLLGVEISRDYEQPANGGGNYYCFDRQSKELVHGRKTIDG